MTTLVKLHRKGRMTLPSKLREAVGVAEGDLIEATVRRGRIVLTPKVAIDRSSFPNADDEYTPTRRKAIDARLDKALAEVMAGGLAGPFESPDQMISDLKKRLKNATLASKTPGRKRQ